MLPAKEKCRSMLSKERKMLLLLHSPFHHRALNTQIMHTKMESTDLLSWWVNLLEWAISSAYAIVCLLSLFSLLGLVPSVYYPWPLNWDYITQDTLPFAGRVSNHGCSIHCGGSKTLYNPAHRLRLNSGLFKGRKCICCMSWKRDSL